MPSFKPENIKKWLKPQPASTLNSILSRACKTQNRDAKRSETCEVKTKNQMKIVPWVTTPKSRVRIKNVETENSYSTEIRLWLEWRKVNKFASEKFKICCKQKRAEKCVGGWWKDQKGRRKIFSLQPLFFAEKQHQSQAMCACHHLGKKIIDLYNENCVYEKGKRGQSIISLLDTFHVSPSCPTYKIPPYVYIPQEKKTLKYFICIFLRIFSLLFFSVEGKTPAKEANT